MERLRILNTRVLVMFLTIIVYMNSGFANTYYVDVSHPSASDSNPGTENLPWLTIQHGANSVAAGDTVIVKSGMYGGVAFTISGTAEAYITFVGETAESVILQGGMEFTKDVAFMKSLAYGSPLDICL